MKQWNAESGYDCWLEYRTIDDNQLRETYSKYCSRVEVIGETALVESARKELQLALGTMLGLTFQDGRVPLEGTGIVAGTFDSSPQFASLATEYNIADLGDEGYIVHSSDNGNIYLLAATDKGVLYATFHLIGLLQQGGNIEKLNVREIPSNGLRMINHWDNMDGSIERGYAGNSIFFRDNRMIAETGRLRDYARLLASGAINAVSINNVNVHREESKLITEPILPDVARVANIFRDYGIRLYLSANFAGPMEIGGLETADPLHPDVCAWWKDTAERIYRWIPDFGGFVVKADSEFRPGPFTYGRNHADGANMFADALKPFGGEVIWRCFVYDCLQDWRDRITDRARAAYDHFMPLDGQFRDNVLLQIKNGPMDFQVREPISPLLGGLTLTNQVMELQIAQEYTGQQRHLCYLVPQWREVLEFDTYAKGQGSTISELTSGRMFGRTRGGIAAVSNIGDDLNWTGHDFAQANFYGFARLAWNPHLSSEQIAREWIRRTFAHDAEAERVILGMLLDSYSIYEAYTAPLGVGWMVNPSHHYGPSVDGYEYSKWGTYHFADCEGIGVDRTASTGTGYTRQYHSPMSDLYESLESCPDELLLFFHHVPYTHVLKSGKTVIQHIYDSHFEGADRAAELLESWNSVERKVDSGKHNRVRERLVHQAEHAQEWRDQINTYFYRKSGIADAQGRPIY
ncbi:alpha-glucuronidase family glycosyl hydrolase [Cohnella mopanensis]|uniref:alpha-glucuronidase family glycosyl hydrolase n=1 Tax=Cohnella mopanensis TaxID=2911966 RepID=UPI001EF82AB2|nr:alpha-glucuronidase family glycosyl hydrolase [Cohnella mopanensis]